MSIQTYREMIESFAAIKGISAEEARDILIAVIKDFYNQLNEGGQDE